MINLLKMNVPFFIKMSNARKIAQSWKKKENGKFTSYAALDAYVANYENDKSKFVWINTLKSHPN